MRFARLAALLLAVTLPIRAFGGVSFDGTVNATALGSTTEITAPPMTVCLWFYDTDLSAFHMLLGFSDTGGTNSIFQLVTQTGGVGGTNLVAAGAYNGTSYAQAATTGTGYAVNTWNSACGVWTSASSRSIFLNGAHKVTETTSITPTSIDAMSVGYRPVLTPGNFPGRIAEVGVWNIALSDTDITSLGGTGGRGITPPCIRPDALVGYYPMWVKGATGIDLFSSTVNELTWGSGTASTDHPALMRCQ